MFTKLDFYFGIVILGSFLTILCGAYFGFLQEWFSYWWVLLIPGVIYKLKQIRKNKKS
jgi:hypothetical protein